jgi:hypothetical protein
MLKLRKKVRFLLDDGLGRELTRDMADDAMQEACWRSCWRLSFAVGGTWRATSVAGTPSRDPMRAPHRWASSARQVVRDGQHDFRRLPAAKLSDRLRKAGGVEEARRLGRSS